MRQTFVIFPCIFLHFMTMKGCPRDEYFEQLYHNKYIFQSYKDTSLCVDTKNGFHKDWIVSEPTRIVDIRFEVTYPANKCCLILFFTFNKRNRHVVGQCFVGSTMVENDTRFNNGFIYLKPGVHNSGCNLKDSTIVCNSTSKLQTHQPVNWFFVLGYQCEHIKYLNASITVIVKSSNEAQSEILHDPVCKNYYKQTSFPNFVGHTLQDEATTMFRLFRVIFLEANCYQHLEEFLCRIFFFEYKNGHIHPPCHLLCKEALTGCWPILQKYSIPLSCSYLPNDTISGLCSYTPVSCGLPEKLENGTVFSENTTLGSVVHYSCNTGYFLAGNVSYSKCQYSGKWTRTNVVCIPLQNYLFYKKLFNVEIIVLDIVIIISILTSGFIIVKHRTEISLIYYIKIQKYFERKNPSVGMESKDYDAFISYASSEYTESFVMDKVTKKLEKDAKLKLFLHQRDCLVGQLITNNILHAMQRSKTAVILLNQDYIDRQWCLFEFAHCHKQHMTDSSFNIIIVLMQPIKQFCRIPSIIQAYLTTTTYISTDDSNMWSRLTHAIIK